jgi:hypothetical protein
MRVNVWRVNVENCWSISMHITAERHIDNADVALMVFVAANRHKDDCTGVKEAFGWKASIDALRKR